MGALFETVLSMSLGAALIALLVLIIRAILGRRPGILMPLLYGLIIVRLILPVSIESPLSMQNLLVSLPQALQAQNSAEDGANIGQTPATVSAADDITPARDPNVTGTYTEPAHPETAVQAAVTKTAVQLSPIDIAAIIWLTGIAGLAAYITVSNIRFTRKLNRNREYCTPEFAALLDECKQQLRIRRSIRAVCISEINTAAVCGVFSPKLLISPQSFEALSLADKKHVLLHELSHIKRGDTGMCLLLTVVSIVHWFNPVIWFTLGLMRRDMEVFCDASVLKVLGEHGRHGYAQTLLNLSEPAIKSNRLVAAMFICRANVKRRIVMISKYRRNKARYTALAVLIAAVIAVTGCTSAADTAETTVPETTPIESATPTQTAEATNTVINTEVDRTAGLIGTCSLDCSDYALSEARISNINKAVSILDETIIPYDEQFEFMDTLGNISEESGWLTAPGYGWEWVTAVFNVEENSSTNDKMIAQAGGGIELVVLAIASAARDNLDCGFTWDDEVEGYLNIGDYGIKNNQYSDGVVIYTSFEGSRITINICSIGLAQAQAVKATSDVIATYSIDNSQYNNPSRMFNIEKAAEILNNTVIHP